MAATLLASKVIVRNANKNNPFDRRLSVSSSPSLLKNLSSILLWPSFPSFSVPISGSSSYSNSKYIIYNDNNRFFSTRMKHKEGENVGYTIPILEKEQSKNSDDRVLASKEREINYGYKPRTSVLMELTDRVGILHDVLKYFWKYDINITRIESRPMRIPTDGHNKAGASFDFFLDFDGSIETDKNVQQCMEALQKENVGIVDKLLILDEEKEVHWFPRHISELDAIANRTLDAGTDLQSDHPGFHDEEYRNRRNALTESANSHRWNQPIQNIEYTQNEIQTWTAVWDRMEPLWERYACKEYMESLQLLKEQCGYSRDTIPQQEDISRFLYTRCKFKMRPVSGLLSSRDFLNGLAFRVFFCTQYIRHHSKPLYTPEPDICHELLGHAPMFANHDFAAFSQEIGLASLGASDEDILKLAHCYWHSVEFGLTKEESDNNNDKKTAIKAYGAGLLSSFGELEHACGSEHDNITELPKPTIKPWDPHVASHQAFPITTYQPVYFLASSLQDAKQKMRKYCEHLPRPFFAFYNTQNDTIHIDRPVKRTRGVPTGDDDDNNDNNQE